MSNFLRPCWFVAMAAWAIVFTASAVRADDGKSKWKGNGTGTTTPDLDRGVDVDVV
jgi:hypothetical protein